MALFFPCDKVYTDTGVGITTVSQDESDHHNAQTHLYVDQLPDIKALDKLKNRVITTHPEETAKKKAAMPKPKPEYNDRAKLPVESGILELTKLHPFTRRHRAEV